MFVYIFPETKTKGCFWAIRAGCPYSQKRAAGYAVQTLQDTNTLGHESSQGTYEAALGLLERNFGGYCRFA